jgi:hypothetical protein
MAKQAFIIYFSSGEGSGGAGPYGGVTGPAAVRAHLNTGLIDTINNHLLTLRSQIDTGETLTLYDEEQVTVCGSLSGTGTVTGTGTVVGFSFPLPVSDGGTGDVTPANARTNLGAAASGANRDITSLGALTLSGPVVLGSSLQWNRVAKTAAYTMVATDMAVDADGTGGAFTVTLPAANLSGQVVHVMKTDSSANAITISRAGTDTINGASTVSLAAQYNSRTLLSDGAGHWYVIAST